MPDSWVPSVDDLRVKLCWICREEERHDKPEQPPRRWTHPCNCTLVAHESCLLDWITAAQQTPERAANALKCPQCSAVYEIISDNPLALRLLDRWNRLLSRVGKVVTVSTIGLVVTTFSAGIYLICTSYGAFALREYLGSEMYDILVSDDPSQWSWFAFTNLPLIPVTLILSRTPLLNNYSPLLPLLFAWPTATPIATSDVAMRAHWEASAATSYIPMKAAPLWPPSPALLCVLFPPLQALYSAGKKRLTHWLLDTREPAPVRIRGYEWAIGGGEANMDPAAPAAFRLQVGAQVGRAAARRQQQQQQQQQVGAVAAPAPAAEVALAPVVQAQVEPVVAVDPPAAALAPAALAAAPPAAGQPVDAPAPNADPAGAAERTIRITGASIGRLIGGALVLPTVSRIMGDLLLHASHGLPLLRLLLAPRPPLLRVNSPRIWSLSASHAESRTPLQWLNVGLRLFLSGSNVWQESDPVWWRNTLGLGIFLVAKDVVKLAHLWLAKRELESRSVKNRSFEGVDLRELDLITRAEIA
ncbi:hypothetical protein FA95DRAFT_1592683 [Auriscalpium vulgare]|uniref:Uncharacterized protein n=1 Tax=Auriscalpium vulgare TaxID=40419 RepID=A0ACB8S730_9AGAM|nr:hypothetical protein FA95DRAFT_1592683 [Auriscalpium vulgare]